jgi:hypothetical protein
VLEASGDADDGVVDGGLLEPIPQGRFRIGLSASVTIVATAVAFQAVMTAGSAAGARTRRVD